MAGFNRKKDTAATWDDEPWKTGDKWDAYVWIDTATFPQIQALRRLIPRKVPPPPGDPAAKGYVRKVLVLAGPSDALVGVTADSKEDLGKLVLGPIHDIVPYTSTAIAMWPKGESGQGGTNPGPHPYGAIWPPPANPDAMVQVQVTSGQDPQGQTWLKTVYHALYRNLTAFMAESVMETGDHRILLELGGKQSDVQQDIARLSGIEGISGFTSHWVLQGP